MFLNFILKVFRFLPEIGRRTHSAEICAAGDHLFGWSFDFWHLPAFAALLAASSRHPFQSSARICSLTQNKLPLIVQEDCPPVSPPIKRYMAPNRKQSPVPNLCASDVKLSSLSSSPQFPELLAKTLQPSNKVPHTTRSVIIAQPTLLAHNTTNNYCPPFYFPPISMQYNNYNQRYVR